MPVVSRLQDFLDRTHTSYGHTVHSPAYTARQLARAEHVPEKEIAKTIVFVGDKGSGMAVLAADCSAKLEGVAGFLRHVPSPSGDGGGTRDAFQRFRARRDATVR